MPTARWIRQIGGNSSWCAKAALPGERVVVVAVHECAVDVEDHGVDEGVAAALGHADIPTASERSPEPKRSNRVTRGDAAPATLARGGTEELLAAARESARVGAPDDALRHPCDAESSFPGLLQQQRVRLLRADGYWPNAKPDEAPVAEPLNKLPKYVASTTLRPPLDWQNATLLEGNVETAVRSLKEEGGGDLQVVGSTQLVKTLLEHDLVDAFRLMIDPLVLGGGKRFLLDDGVKRPLQLRDSTITSSGAILATYDVVLA